MTQEMQWDSTLSFIFAMIGAAVGLGNIWRFSYVIYTNGGGSFFIPYFIAIAIMGIPFLILEYSIGFSFKNTFSNILKKINPKFEFIAWLLIIFVFIVVIYYMVILSWDFIYFLSSFNFAWENNVVGYFTNNVGGGSNLSQAGSVIVPTAIGVIVMWFVLWYISHKDIENGIGKFSKILIPLLFIIMGFIIIYSLTLPGAGIGIDELLTPEWDELMDINMWLAAFSQIIFSLSMGQAIATTYASYLPEKSSLTDNVLIVVASNSAFEVFTAFGVFSILGFMSSNTGTLIVQLVTEGTGLIFMVLPMIFNQMGLIGHIFAPLLFLAILFAGITSALGFLEPMLSSIMSKFNLSRKRAATYLSIIGCICSLLLTTGIGSYLVQIIDSFVNEFGILFLIGVQCIIFGWIYGLDDLIPILNENGFLKVGKLWVVIIKYLLPTFLFIIWTIGIIKLFANAEMFTLTLDSLILIAVFIFSFILTRVKSTN